MKKLKKKIARGWHNGPRVLLFTLYLELSLKLRWWQAVEIIQGTESIPWVRCASGKVYSISHLQQIIWKKKFRKKYCWKQVIKFKVVRYNVKICQNLAFPEYLIDFRFLVWDQTSARRIDMVSTSADVLVSISHKSFNIKMFFSCHVFKATRRREEDELLYLDTDKKLGGLHVLYLNIQHFVAKVE